MCDAKSKRRGTAFPPEDAEGTAEDDGAAVQEDQRAQSPQIVRDALVPEKTRHSPPVQPVPRGPGGGSIVSGGAGAT